jgi:23S rRNA pseudouridine1911/1915/1917 synthase
MSLQKKHGIDVLYEDNHLIVLNKGVSDIVQGDQTGDISLDQRLKGFLKERDAKPGNVFVGIPHRLDRPVSGVVVATLEHYLTRNTKQNKSYCHSNAVKDAKHAVLHYRYLVSSDRYHLLEIRLETGRHHQIRTQLASIGCPIKGDVKYGAKRPNRDGGISLHARSISFIHPVKNTPLEIVAPFPSRDIFHLFGED